MLHYLYEWKKENSVYMGKYIESDEFVYILSGEKEETMKAYKRLIAGTAAAVMLTLTCGGCGAEKEPDDHNLELL